MGQCFIVNYSRNWAVDANREVWTQTGADSSQCTKWLRCNNHKIFSPNTTGVNWNSICNSADANVSYIQFIHKFNELYDKCIPRTKKRVYTTRSKPKSPWISFALLKSINRKNKLYKRSIKKPTAINIETYKKYRNKLNTLLRLVKQNFYCDLLHQKIISKIHGQFWTQLLFPKQSTNNG